MSLAAFAGAATSSSSASSLEELHNILNDKYDEKNVLSKRLARTINCRNLSGVAWLTPDNMLQRINDFVTRIYEDKGVSDEASQNSYRHYSDFLLLVVPTVGTTRAISANLFLVDSDDPTNILNGDQEVDVDSSDGPVLVGFNMGHCVVNRDRTHVSGAETHRRVGLCWDITVDGEQGSAQNTTTYFSIKATWRRKISLKPSYYKVGSPLVIPIDVGFCEHVMSKNPTLVRQFVRAGLDVSRHMKFAPTVKNNLSLVSDVDKKIMDASEVKVVKPVVKRKPRRGRASSRGSVPSRASSADSMVSRNSAGVIP
ncbi:movement protein [Blueberry necrotic ring blotch virus]|uniref:Movement protein n=1 Tax=Blueberry necrotic ring blotch virus TaxID=1094249 RepID=G5DFD2_9VIRU|nr:movement protein [Blueberry necrotic ring blotch virus]AEQ55305.1 movement protein [Blueberry necrotic ring blotch virus]